MEYCKPLKAAIIFLFSAVMVVFPLLPAEAGADYSKISPDIIKIIEDDSFEDDELIEVLIHMEEQADTREVADTVRRNMPLSVTKDQKKMLVRHAVVNSLRDTAQNSQAPLLTYLENKEKSGRAAEIKSYFIVSIVYAEVDSRVIAKLSKRSDVRKILPNSSFTMEEPELNRSYELMEGSSEIEWNIEQIGAPAVWDTFGYDGSGVVVGIIDTGVEWDHEALKTKWRGYNPAAPDNPDPVYNWFDAVNGEDMPYDENGHGTHVAGTVLGAGPDGTNLIGVAPGARWIAANAFTPDGIGMDDWFLAAGEYMLAPTDGEGNPNPDMAPDIINNSWGSEQPEEFNEWYRDMVQNWRNAGILPVFGAGNSGPGSGTVLSPGNYPESFTVAATDANNNLASYSSRGPAPYSPPHDLKPDISAPGVNIRSAIPGGGYAERNGTSMATPHIAGVAALILSAEAELTVDELEAAILDTAEPLTDSNYPETPNYGYGYGLVNAADAVMLFSTYGKITGQVLTEGEDNEPPVIYGFTEIEGSYSFAGYIPPIVAGVQDDISVMEVELWVSIHGDSEWHFTSMNIINGDHRDGYYEGFIPTTMVQDPGFDYRIKATDWGGNETFSDAWSVEVDAPAQPGASWDFEEYPIDWELFGCWEWGEPDFEDGPEPYTGNKLIGTNLLGDYTIDWHYLISPPLDLRDSEITEAYLHFKNWQDIHNFDDVFVSIYDGTASYEIDFSFAGEPGQWVDQIIDLTDHTGLEKVIWVDFLLISDYGNHPGWYIDDVQFVVDEEPPGAGSALMSEPGDCDGALNVIEPHVSKYPDYITRFRSERDNFEILPGSSIEVQSQGVPGHIPLEAEITVLETETSVLTNPADGTFDFYLEPTPEEEEWTLRITCEEHDEEDIAFSIGESETLELGHIVLGVDEMFELTLQIDPPGGGTVEGGGFYEDGASVSVSAEADEAYDFVNWTKEGAEESSQPSFNYTMLSEDVTLTANFEIKTYTVTFKDWDGTVLGTDTVEHGGSATAPADPEREDYTFTGWDTTFDNVTSNLTVTATYESITATPVITTAAQTLSIYIINIEGTAAPDATITITGGWAVSTGQADGAGNFSIAVTLTPDEVNTLSVTAQQEGEQESEPATVAITHEEGELVYGDIKGDGNVGTADAILIARAIVGLTVLNDSQFERGDVNGDGSIGTADAIYIARKIVGLINIFPVEEV